MHGIRGGGGGGSDRPDPSPEKHKSKGFLSDAGLVSIKIHSVTKPAFNGGPSFARQRNTILMAFRWQADDGPMQ